MQFLLQLDEAIVALWRERDVPQHSSHRVRPHARRLHKEIQGQAINHEDLLLITGVDSLSSKTSQSVMGCHICGKQELKITSSVMMSRCGSPFTGLTRL